MEQPSPSPVSRNMCCCCLPRKCVFCLRLRTGCLVIAGTELAVHGVVMCYVATRGPIQ